MASKTEVLGLLFITCALLPVVMSMTNCHVGRNCSSCPEGYYQLVKINPTLEVRVCCEGCRSKYLQSTNFPNPTCTCYYDRMEEDSTCWKGEQCCGCDTVTLNDMPVCCSRCRAGTLAYSSVNCTCDITES